MAKFVKAVSGMNHSVIYTDDSGKNHRFSGGTWAWRNHNPGNIRPGNISKRYHQIGVVNNFAVFPDKNTGHNALLEVLRTTYWNSSIEEMMIHFAPPKENNTPKYIKFLHGITGIKDDKKIKDFDDHEFEKLWQGIEHIESSKEGEIIEIFQVTQVRKKHSSILYYCLGGDTWISKQQCFELAKDGKVDLELCISRLGNQYLRTTPSSLFQQKLNELIDKKYRE